MLLPRNDTAPDQLADSDAITTVSFVSVITIDDGWLEAVLDNLALAKLPRNEGILLLERLDAFERDLAAHARPVDASKPQYPIVVGDLFDDTFNAHEMRAPDAMDADNVLDSIERAARYFVAEGHGAALRQLVFFISGNIEEVLADDDADEE